VKLTPVLPVPAIEPLLPLWESLGFRRTAEVPHGDALGFVILQREGAELMLQTFASMREDEPRALAGTPVPGAGVLFVQVDDLAAARAALPADVEVFVPERKTPYGATETFLRDRAGNVIILAQFG
jgi:hypothetical protein